jgi:hypothetical protein
MRVRHITVEDGRVYWMTESEYDGELKEYRTNREGEGIWIWSARWNNWAQIAGTCQFSLHQKTRSGMYKAIKRYFDENIPRM